MLKEAKEDGLLRSISNVESTAEILVVFLQGSQITAVMDPDGFNEERILNQLEAYLDLLRLDSPAADPSGLQAKRKIYAKR